MDDLAAMDYEVSVASLRLDDLTPQFVFKLADTGVQGLTLAPECGSDRMRRIINKQFTNAEILDKATWIFENGIQNLKLYYMVGLPFEEHADVEAIVELTDQIRERMLAVARGRGRIGRIHPSVNPFVPKPGTPYQWLPHGGPEGVRPEAAVPAQGLLAHAERGRGHQERAHGDRPVDPGPGRPARGVRPRDRGAGADGLQARDARGGARPLLLPLPSPGEGRDPALGRPRQRGRPSRTSGRSSSAARRSGCPPTARRSRAASAAGSASRPRIRSTRCPRSGRVGRPCPFYERTLAR